MLYGTVFPILSIVFSISYLLLLLGGCIVCLKRSFTEGVIFFMLMISYEILIYLGMNYFDHLPTLLTSLSKAVLIIAFSVLILGVHKRVSIK